MPHVAPKRTHRRSLLLGSTAMLLAAFLPSRPARASLPGTKSRSNWRFCSKCSVLFHELAGGNQCAAGGGHLPEGYDFDLPYDGRETRTTQTRWVCCKYCSALFYGGYRQKGRCPVRRGYEPSGHVADPTFQYALAHGVDEGRNTQAGWRFCSKCFVLFFDGDRIKGCCQAGGPHVAQGYNFVLPYRGQAGTSPLLQSQQNAAPPPQ